MSPATHFSDPAAVEAWDSWFRWREGGVLRDLTIDSTWQRVADAIAAVEGVQAPLWARRFVEAFSHWRLLPDARLLRLAGTGNGLEALPPPRAVLNAAAFVESPRALQARFDRHGFVDAVALTVRLLDDALLAGDATPTGPGLRIGLIGMADALRLLGLPYDSLRARQCAGGMASALSEGALRGATELARARGSVAGDRQRLAEFWAGRGAPPRLVEDVLRWGVRHSELTAIEPQPRLALLANNVSDALDPCSFATTAPKYRNGNGRESMSPGRNAGAEAPVLAQIELRAAMQPWIDAPIEYPLITATEPDQEAIEASGRLASKYGLRPLTLRRARALALTGGDMDGEA